MTNRLLENIKHFAVGGPAPEPEWLTRGAELVRREKADDQKWRTGFQEMYRKREKNADRPGLPLDEFYKSVTVRDLVLSRVESICSDAGIKDPKTRASEIFDTAFACCPSLATHVWIRIGRLWWYTESTREGRTASPDLFDDALLNYLAELDLILTPDRALMAFGRTAFPEKQQQLLSPEAFLAEYLHGA